MAKAQKKPKPEYKFTPNEFIPCACHYSANSVLTKNGELVQTFKIPYNHGLSDSEFRDQFRNAVLNSLDPSKFAVWTHLVRSKVTASPNLNSPDLSEKIDSFWKLTLPNEVNYENSIYISVVIDSDNFSIFKPQNYLRNMIAKLEYSYRNRSLASKEEELTQAVNSLIENLDGFNTEKLSLYKIDETYYSAHLDFYTKILRFEDVNMPLPMADLSKVLFEGELNFNTYSGLIHIAEPEKNLYGAVITVKEPTCLKAGALEEILNLDAEIVISQSVDFAYGNKYLAAIEKQKYIDSISEERRFAKIVELDKVDIEPDNFALVQTNILTVSPSQKTLQKNIATLTEHLSDMGLVSYLEDLKAEKSYWSVMPGNFAFLRRQDSIAKKDVFHFTCFGSDKFSAVENCMFNRPVTYFETQDGFIYPFHFLHSDFGHNLIVSYSEENRQLLANLLFAQVSKLTKNLIYYDADGKFQNIANRLGAKYLTTLDLEQIKNYMAEPNSVVVISSIKGIAENDGFEFFANFLEYAGSKNCNVIVCASPEDNCEAFLPSFRSQFFFTGNMEKYADNFDLFADEIQMIDLLNENEIYLKTGTLELMIDFNVSDDLKKLLLAG